MAVYVWAASANDVIIIIIMGRRKKSRITTE